MKHFFNVMFGISNEVHKFETDPVEQYHFHLAFTWIWILAMIGVLFIVPHNTGQEKVALVILEVSLWANFVSHFTAVGASIAGIYASHQEEILSGHIVRGFFGRIKRRGVKLPVFTNPNGLLGAEHSDTAWVDQLIADKESDTDLGDFTPLKGEPPAPGDIFEPEVHI